MTEAVQLNWSVAGDVYRRFRERYGPDDETIRQEAQRAMADWCGHSRVAQIYETEYPPEDDHCPTPSEGEHSKKEIDHSHTENFAYRIRGGVVDAFTRYYEADSNRRYKGRALSDALYAHLTKPLHEKYLDRRHGTESDEPDTTPVAADGGEGVATDDQAAGLDDTESADPIATLPTADSDLVNGFDVRSAFHATVEKMQTADEKGWENWKAVGPRVQRKAAAAIHHLLDRFYSQFEGSDDLPWLRREKHILSAIREQLRGLGSSETLAKYERLITSALNLYAHPVHRDEIDGRDIPEKAVRYFDALDADASAFRAGDTNYVPHSELMLQMNVLRDQLGLATSRTEPDDGSGGEGPDVFAAERGDPLGADD